MRATVSHFYFHFLAPEPPIGGDRADLGRTTPLKVGVNEMSPNEMAIDMRMREDTRGGADVCYVGISRYSPQPTELSRQLRSVTRRGSIKITR